MDKQRPAFIYLPTDELKRRLDEYRRIKALAINNQVPNRVPGAVVRHCDKQIDYYSRQIRLRKGQQWI